MCDFFVVQYQSVNRTAGILTEVQPALLVLFFLSRDDRTVDLGENMLLH